MRGVYFRSCTTRSDLCCTRDQTARASHSTYWIGALGRLRIRGTRHDRNQGRGGRVDRWLSMRSGTLSTALAAGARVPLPLPDVPEGIRSAIHGVRECQARRPALDAREPIDLQELERRRAEFLQCLRHPSDLSPGRERQHRRDNRQPGRPGSCASGRAVWHRERASLDQQARSASCQAYRRLEA